MRSLRQDLEPFARFEHVAFVGTPGFDCKLPPQHEITIRAFAVKAPRNQVEVRQRERENLNIRAYGDRLDILDLIVRHSCAPGSSMSAISA